MGLLETVMDRRSFLKHSAPAAVAILAAISTVACSGGKSLIQLLEEKFPNDDQKFFAVIRGDEGYAVLLNQGEITYARSPVDEDMIQNINDKNLRYAYADVAGGASENGVRVKYRISGSMSSEESLLVPTEMRVGTDGDYTTVAFERGFESYRSTGGGRTSSKNLSETEMNDRRNFAESNTSEIENILKRELRNYTP